MNEVDHLKRLERKAVLIEQERKGIELRLNAVGLRLKAEQAVFGAYQRSFKVVEAKIRQGRSNEEPAQASLRLLWAKVQADKLKTIWAGLDRQQATIERSKQSQAEEIGRYLKEKKGLERIAHLSQQINAKIANIRSERDFENSLEGFIARHALLSDNHQKVTNWLHKLGSNCNCIEPLASATSEGETELDNSVSQADCHDRGTVLEQDGELAAPGEISAGEQHSAGQRDFRSAESKVNNSQQLINSGLNPALDQAASPPEQLAEWRNESYQSFEQFQDRIVKFSAWQHGEFDGLQLRYLSDKGHQIEVVIDRDRGRALSLLITLGLESEYKRVQAEKKELIATLKRAGYLVGGIVIRRG